MWLSIVCVLIFVPVYFFAWATFGESLDSTEHAREDRLPVALRKEIQKIVPFGHVVRSRDVNVEGCGPSKSDPAVIGDFNGDGRNDYAILLRSNAGTSRQDGALTELFLLVFLDIEGRWAT